MIYQRLAKVFLICSDEKVTLVVPAKAGTQTPWRQICARSRHSMNEARAYWVYILASGMHGTLYIGVTNNLRNRLEQHRDGHGSEFVKKYGVCHLVYVEEFASPQEAIAREKQLKNWQRDWKIRLIQQDNPDWSDLSHLL
jgi:putative endonuclease